MFIFSVRINSPKITNDVYYRSVTFVDSSHNFCCLIDFGCLFNQFLLLIESITTKVGLYNFFVSLDF